MSFFSCLQEAAELWDAGEEIQGFSVLTPECSDPPKEVEDCSDSEGTQCAARKSVRTRRWTASEDQLLLEIAQRYKLDWRRIAKYFPGKPKSAIKRRWENKFDPHIKKTPWTQAEDTAILSLLARFGPVWKEISKELPGRPPDIVKNRYYGHIKRMRDIRERKRREDVSETALNDILDIEWETLLAQPESGLECEQEERKDSAREQKQERYWTRSARAGKYMGHLP